MLPAELRIFVCTEAVDLRRSFDGLALLARQVLAQDPMSGALFVFVNKRKDRLKALWWDRSGYCLLYKRLHRAVFVLPPGGSSSAPSVRIDGTALAGLLEGRTRTRSKEYDRNLN
jgi:transposase